jgi:hypothetical protein
MMEWDDSDVSEVERIYLEHPDVENIAVFGDRMGQRVALVVSELTEADLRPVLSEIASLAPACACITDFVALPPDDPLVPPMFARGDQRRDLIWQLLVGCIDTLTRAADRMSPTGKRPSAARRCSGTRHCPALVRAG